MTPERTAACPYCGEPKDRHAYASPTSCVLGGFPPTKIESAAQTWESHWLIERPVEGETHPVYWSGKGWTPDPWQAKRFVTEAKATRAIRVYLHPFIPTVVEAKAVSHGFEVSRGR